MAVIKKVAKKISSGVSPQANAVGDKASPVSNRQNLFNFKSPFVMTERRFKRSLLRKGVFTLFGKWWIKAVFYLSYFTRLDDDKA